MQNHYYCVIMAGGVGSRFWPLSRASNPKQFLDILGTGKSLIQQTFERFRMLMPAENIFIVSNNEYGELIKEQLPDIPDSNILLEPYRRNTAPCIAYAAYRIKTIDPDAIMVVAPSDHLITKEEEFLRVVSEGLDFVSDNEVLLTIGIQPSRPETGYGYIQLERSKSVDHGERVFHKVKTFTEKPDVKLAEVFLESGEFFWNSGIFFWSINAILNAFGKFLPEINNAFAKGIDVYNSEQETAYIEQTYAECRNISIDYGIMEKSDKVFVITADFGWSDLGTWGSLYEHTSLDNNNNSRIGDNIFLYETNNSLIKVTGGKLVVLQGMADFIVVDSEDVLLVCKKDQEQRIKSFVSDIKLEKGDLFI